MLPLNELQRRFADIVRGAEASPLTAAIIADPPGAAARLAIYQNHYRVVLVDVLAAAFPVVRRLVGEAFFGAAARRYIRDEPPRGPCLFEYGGGFPQFLGDLAEARRLAYLADTARLEWAIHQAWHAPDTAAVDADTAGQLIAGNASAIGLRLHPSCRLIASPFPIDRIWHLHQPGCGEPPPIELNHGGVALLVSRQGDEVGWIKLGPGAFAFLGAVMEARNLGAALACALEIEPDFAGAALLAALIEAGLVAAFTIPDLGEESP